MSDGGLQHSATAVAEQATDSLGRVSVPGVLTIELPSKADLAYVGGIAALAAFGLVEWPLAAILGLGHILSQNKRNQTLRAFGEALDEA